MKKFLSSFLIASIFLSSFSTVFATETTASGNGSDIPAESNQDITTFSVTIPTTLPVSVDGSGVVTVSPSNKITNNSSGAVEIKSVEIISQNEWELIDFNTDFTEKKVNIKEYGFQINGTNVEVDGSCEVEFDIIGSNSEISFTYNANIAVQEKALENVEIAQVIFTVGWNEQEIINYQIQALEDILDDEGNANLNVGESVQLNAIAMYSVEQPTWSSSDDNIISVTSDGLATAIAPGSAIITYSLNGIDGELQFIVSQPLNSISLNKNSITLEIGENETLTVSYDPSNTTDDKTVEWTSDDENIVSVVDGIITANNQGTTIITANVNGKTDICEVTVPQPSAEVLMNNNLITIENGETYQLGIDSEPESVRSWVSSDENVVTVDSNGLVTAVNPGSAIITVEQDETSITYNIIVTQKLNSISLNQNSLTLNIGETSTLTVVYNPDNTTEDKTVEWSSNDESIVSVVDGVVIANNCGTAIVTANVNGKTDTCEVVVPQSSQVPTEISLNTNSITIENSETYQLEVISESDSTCYWSSSDENIAMVDDNGLVTAVSAGSATITVEQDEASATCNVTVTQKLVSISLSQSSLTLNVGETSTLTIVYNPDDTTDDKTVTWSSSDNDIVSVENGVLTASSCGTATITANVNGKTDTCEVVVPQPSQSSQPSQSLTEISLNTNSITVENGETYQLEVISESESTCSWSSSDENIAMVDDNGLVTAISSGSTIITVKQDGVSATCNVSVTQKLNSISLNQTSLTLNEGETSSLTVMYSPDNTTDDKTVEWISNDEAIATVEDGLVTAISEGTTTITATCDVYSVSCDVTVLPISISVYLNEDSLTLENGETYQLEASSSCETTYSWSSSDVSVATVDDNGLITAIGPGSAIITVSQDEISTTCSVIVTQKLNGISLSQTSLTLNEGETSTITVTYNPDNTTEDKTVTWISNNEFIVTVADGMITAVSEGTATITATVGDYSVSCDITVVSNITVANSDEPKENNINTSQNYSEES